ncbi:Uma2 family endonuclease [Agriterribacter humi]|jgi:Uma2 family endonuclease|uniref:Uma2 family endonuclease n=1 Tax=Agriterribacter humi TaxID=1104781 RepID=UPI0012646859|nr:Uma2 family endonuclease [Agriterribacter humi]
MENEVKEPAPKYNYISPEAYLEAERASKNRSEYYDGHIIAMAGASLRHNRIAMNLYREVGFFLKGNRCNMLPSDMRVSTPLHDSYMYPDAVIVCGEPQLEDDKFDTLLNPSVIFEILSPSTGSMDKGRKFFFYREIPSLKEYIMIDALKLSVIVSRRQSGNAWAFENIDEGSFTIQTIGFTLTLQEIYDGTNI